MCNDARQKLGLVGVGDRKECSVATCKVYMMTDGLANGMTVGADAVYPSRVVWRIVDELKELGKRKMEGLKADKLREEIKMLRQVGGGIS